MVMVVLEVMRGASVVVVVVMVVVAAAVDLSPMPEACRK
jgi:hypothetical protein